MKKELKEDLNNLIYQIKCNFQEAKEGIVATTSSVEGFKIKLLEEIKKLINKYEKRNKKRIPRYEPADRKHN